MSKFEAGARVRILESGALGRVFRAYSIVEGIVLSRPLAVIDLDEPDELGHDMISAFIDEVEILGEQAAGRPEAGRRSEGVL